MSAFGGMLTVIVQSHDKAGRITLKASAEGLHDGVLKIKSVKNND